MTSDASPYEDQLVEHLPHIERAVASFARRYGMSADDAADLSSSIKARIVEEDYAIFRKFRGESSLSTYLTVVITMMAREQRVQERGRWRPSAAAQRQGPVAVGLETLVHQKGYSLPEAAAVMRSRGDTTLSDRQLGDLLRALPRRTPMRPVEVAADALQESPAREGAESVVMSVEAAERRGSVEKLLDETLAALPLEDRLLLKLRFWQEASVADAARVLGVEQRPLYRRLEKLMGELRERLAREGVTVDHVRDLVGEA
ncbi:MAG TPA: sigma-70 family RNA polymerase sigma factor [Gemmatimonadaceae bacterium]|nr:sigma-70 family RNA polymerase sigma factor [Gemmatimonadaceae bacterium]